MLVRLTPDLCLMPFPTSQTYASSITFSPHTDTKKQKMDHCRLVSDDLLWRGDRPIYGDGLSIWEIQRLTKAFALLAASFGNQCHVPCGLISISFVSPPALMKSNEQYSIPRQSRIRAHVCSSAISEISLTISSSAFFTSRQSGWLKLPVGIWKQIDCGSGSLAVYVRNSLSGRK